MLGAPPQSVPLSVIANAGRRERCWASDATALPRCPSGRQQQTENAAAGPRPRHQAWLRSTQRLTRSRCPRRRCSHRRCVSRCCSPLFSPCPLSCCALHTPPAVRSLSLTQRWRALAARRMSSLRVRSVCTSGLCAARPPWRCSEFGRLPAVSRLSGPACGRVLARGSSAALRRARPRLRSAKQGSRRPPMFGATLLGRSRTNAPW